MILIVGLGNPGPKYETTRHNAGFLLLDEIAEQNSIALPASKFKGDLGKGEVLNFPVLMLKPQTFMNRSGQSVVAVMRFYKIAPEDVVVIYDDIDLESGKVKARVGGGAGGHNGIRSIIQDTGQQGFHRIKVGVGRPGERQGTVSDWVLGPFTDEELLALQQGILEDVMLRLKQIFQAKKNC